MEAFRAYINFKEVIPEVIDKVAKMGRAKSEPKEK